MSITELFETCCINNDLDNIKNFLKGFSHLLINYDNGYFFDLMADHGNLEALKLFIEHGQNPTLDNNYAIFKCADMKNDECVMYLLSQGISIDVLKTNINYKYYLQIIDHSAEKGQSCRAHSAQQ